MLKLASENIGQEVHLKSILELNEKEKYDDVWHLA